MAITQQHHFIIHPFCQSFLSASKYSAIYFLRSFFFSNKVEDLMHKQINALSVRMTANVQILRLTQFMLHSVKIILP